MYHAPTGRPLGRLTDPALVKPGLYDKPGVAHLDLVQSLAISPDGQRLASGGFREVKIWQRSAQARLAELAGVGSPARAVAASADGKWIAIGETGGAVQLFDATAGKLAKTLAGHAGPVTGVAFFADGSRLATVSEDKSVRIWNVADGQQAILWESPAALGGVAIVSGGSQLASGGADNIIRVWDVPKESPADKMLRRPRSSRGTAVRSLRLRSSTWRVSRSCRAARTRRCVNGTSRGLARRGSTSLGHRWWRWRAVRMASASRAAGENNIVRVWNGENGQQVAELKGDLRTQLYLEKMQPRGSGSQGAARGTQAGCARGRDAGEERSRGRHEGNAGEGDGGQDACAEARSREEADGG